MKLYRKNSILEEKNSGQKSITLAHSGGHNLVKMIFCLFFSHYGSKVSTICLKSWLKSIEFSRKSKKWPLWADISEKALQILF